MLEALETPPRSTDQLFWTDFVELRALIHPDRCYSYGDLSGLERRARDTSSNNIFSAEKRWGDMISFAAVRENEFGNAYPFKVSEDQDTLELNNTEQGDNPSEKNLYLGLLLSSLMRHFPKTQTGTLGRYFEQVSYAVFKKLMPEGSETRATWAGGGDEAPYTGTLYNKMKQIASDLRCTANFRDRDFKTSDTGDGGIDLISWHPMADERDGMPIAFAQCGCSKSDWKFKQLEASPNKHGSHLPVRHPWTTYYFMPLDLRHPDGGWAYESDIGQAIIVDRLRLVRLASQYNLYGDLPELTVLRSIMELQYS